MAGIFISRGMIVAAPTGDLTIGVSDDGNSTGNLSFHVQFDVCPTWMELSLRHLEEAKARRADREAAWAGANGGQKVFTLEREFEASMQAIMAAAVAIDAFYAIIKTHVVLPPSLVNQWRTKRTARYLQVTEVLRRAFHLEAKGTAALGQNLKEIYRLRDFAVHPSGNIGAPILHPELNVGVEWRFAYYRARNAELVVNAATWILWGLAHGGKPKHSRIVEYMNNLKLRLAESLPNGHPNAAVAVAPSER
jgi:hypothetical protein